MRQKLNPKAKKYAKKLELKRLKRLRNQQKQKKNAERRKQKAARQKRRTERNSVCEKYQWNRQTYAAVQQAPTYIQDKLKGFYEQAKDPALADKDAIRTPIWEKYYVLLHNIQDTYNN